MTESEELRTLCCGRCAAILAPDASKLTRVEIEERLNAHRSRCEVRGNPTGSHWPRELRGLKK